MYYFFNSYDQQAKRFTPPQYLCKYAGDDKCISDTKIEDKVKDGILKSHISQMDFKIQCSFDGIQCRARWVNTT